MKYITSIADQTYTIEINDERHLSIDGRTCEVDFLELSDQPLYSLVIQGQSYEAYVLPHGDRWEIVLQGQMYEARVEDERERRLRSAFSGQALESQEFQLRAPMPGLIAAVLVHEGQEILKGSVVIVLESMKMQNELKAPRAGTLLHLRVQAGQTVEQNQILAVVG
ncbi:MAG: biotin/lipoyl-containing protein [Anaerolineales bacterium]|jgi:biotin carboxyl carrier protein